MKKLLPMKRYVFLLFTWCILARCQSKEEVSTKTLEIKNQTNYIFDIPINVMRDTLTSFFLFDSQYKNSFLSNVFYKDVDMGSGLARKRQVTFKVETKSSSSIGGNYFLQPETKDDIFLHSFGEAWYSSVYYQDGKPMDYIASFSLKTDSIEASKTRVSVAAIDPVVFRRKIGVSAHGKSGDAIKVQSSSIEEYSILLFIGTKIGDTSMPKLKLPH